MAARRKSKLQLQREHEMWVLLPPAEQITPAVALRWLHRTCPPLARLSSMAAYPDVILHSRDIGLRKKERERALRGMRIIAIDVRGLTEACAKVLAVSCILHTCVIPQAIKFALCTGEADTSIQGNNY